MLKPEIVWDECHISWMKAHYRHTKNEEVIEELKKRGLEVSVRTMTRKARKLGLKKSTQFVHRCTREAMEKMQEQNRRTGYAGSIKGGKISGRQEDNKGRFKHGESPIDRFGEDKWKKIKESADAKRKETINREKRRIYLGLEQKTSLRLIKNFSRKEILLRYEAHKRGYIVYREEGTIYYSKETERVPRIEQKLKDNDIVLLPIWMRGKKTHETNSVVIMAGNMIQ